MNYSEEEQLEKLKHFWQDYGTAILIGLAVALASFAGWKWWEREQVKQAVTAAQSYEKMLQAGAALRRDEKNATENASFQREAKELTEKYADTAYGANAGLMLAARAVAVDNFKEAEKQLRWVLAQKPEEGVRLIAVTRLARVLLGQGQAQAALDLLAKEEDSAFVGSIEEVKGDALLALNKPAEAKKAYLKAAERLAKAKQPRPLLEMKLADQGVAMPKPAEADAN